MSTITVIKQKVFELNHISCHIYDNQTDTKIATIAPHECSKTIETDAKEIYVKTLFGRSTATPLDQTDTLFISQKYTVACYFLVAAGIQIRDLRANWFVILGILGIWFFFRQMMYIMTPIQHVQTTEENVLIFKESPTVNYTLTLDNGDKLSYKGDKPLLVTVPTQTLQVTSWHGYSKKVLVNAYDKLIITSDNTFYGRIVIILSIFKVLFDYYFGHIGDIKYSVYMGVSLLLYLVLLFIPQLFKVYHIEKLPVEEVYNTYHHD
ncbi:hypothetical protein GMA11_07675 [Granulicatella sp. zg-ZJ]|uniref:hypothetical protein n=1 Tax=Granulicatella sp. zg-ZJ TaxID=2678504 RepID=UPI0013D6F462|nr:hypothetical protein [Granulicatella sp. zg-ZJ]NEW63272.1 hypothetical protein [Granulicatella sp. zg-ZJ]